MQDAGHCQSNLGNALSVTVCIITINDIRKLVPEAGLEPARSLPTEGF